MNIFHIIVLTLSGLAMFYASYSRLFKPASAVFLKNYVNDPSRNQGNHPDVYNEVRGVGAVMVLGGIVCLLGALWEDIRFTSFVVACVIFMGVVVGRLVSIAIDGIPAKELLSIFYVELFIGVLNVFCLSLMLM
ncbi:MAG: DUF4345 domain-containing protein [Bacteroidota bacterium]